MSDLGRTLPAFIKTANDLVTSHEATREGFLKQALAKTQEATPFVTEARRLWSALQAVEHIDSLLGQAEFRNDLIAAAGFSDKARGRLSPAELDESVKQVFATIFSQAGAAFREEIFYRYLLTKGDSLGGKMRNLTGASATKQFTAALLQALHPREVQVQTAQKSGKVQRIAWEQRLLMFDVTPKFINKNIDVILLEQRSTKLDEKQLREMPDHYRACGELKGGIDPAGADEHWKTARSALDRIIESFDRVDAPHPQLFFAGAAIEVAMANEIFARLKDGRLSYAANLTVNEQVTDFANWLVTL